MSRVARRFLTPLLAIFLAGSLAGCYTLLKHPEVTDDSEEIPVIYSDWTFPPIILLPWPIHPPPVPPEPAPPDRHEPPPPPPPPPTRPIDPKQPEKPATEVKEKVPPGNKTLERESIKTS
jgi:hypothetical protein